MKKTFTILLYIIVFTIISGRVSAQWSNYIQIGGYRDNDAISVIDNVGNKYVAGSFNTQLEIDTILLGSNGYSDIYVAKINTANRVEWIKQIGSYDPMDGSYIEGVSDIKLDASSNCIIVSGNNYDPLTLDSISILASSAFIAKINFSGEVQWIKSVAPIGAINERNVAPQITLGSSGEVYWSGGMMRNSSAVDGIQLPPGGYLAKTLSDGTMAWALPTFKGFFPTHLVYSTAGLTFCGVPWGGQIMIDSVSIPHIGLKAIVGRLDTNGYFIWAKVQQGTINDESMGLRVAVGPHGSAVVIGRFGGDLIGGSDTLHNPGPAFDGYWMKFDTDGNYVSMEQAGSGNACGYGILDQPDGSFYQTGYFSNTLTFGSYSVIAQNGTDMFVSLHDSNGVCQGIRTFGRAEGMWLSQNAAGTILVTARIWNTVLLGSDTITSTGQRDCIAVEMQPMVTGEPELSRSGNQSLQIYANPTTGKCRVVLPEELDPSRLWQLTIRDLKGTVVSNLEIDPLQPTIPIDISAQSEGIYVLTISDGRKSVTGKIVFEKP
jgi:hypothetical protein